MRKRYTMQGYPQLEIVFKFPLSALALHGGLENLDVIWDDGILPLLTECLHQNDFIINNSDLMMDDTRLAYTLVLFGWGKPFNPKPFVNILKQHGFAQGLRIALCLPYGDCNWVYPHKNEAHASLNRQESD